MTLSVLLHDGNPWLLLACVLVLAGLATTLSTRPGRGIDSHPFSKPGTGGGLASDLPPELLGRDEFEPRLWPRRAGRRAPMARRRTLMAVSSRCARLRTKATPVEGAFMYHRIESRRSRARIIEAEIKKLELRQATAARMQRLRRARQAREGSR